MKKLVSVVLSLALLLGLLPFTLPAAQAADPSISMALGQSSAAAGGTITVTYSVTGRKGNIDAYLYIDGEWEDTKNLSAASGSFSFTLPKFGKSGQIEITADDGYGGYISSFSQKFTITNSPDPIEANFRIDKTSVAAGDDVSVSWKLTGGIDPKVYSFGFISAQRYGRLAIDRSWQSISVDASMLKAGSAQVLVPSSRNTGYFRMIIHDEATGQYTNQVSQTFTITGAPYLIMDGWKNGQDIESETWGWAYFQHGMPQTGWKQDGGKWFYLQSENYLTKLGWHEEGGHWYFFSWDDGVMQTGWFEDKGDWFYANASGVMQTGWLESGGSWYYLGGDGKMRTGWVSTGGAWYYMNKDGAMQTGWVKDGNNWYYLKADGSMATGWVQDGRSWYYMNASGVMQTGWVNAGGAWYYMNSSGAMRTGWLEQGSSWYYLTPSGSMATGEYTVDGTASVFNASGVWVSYK